MERRRSRLDDGAVPHGIGTPMYTRIAGLRNDTLPLVYNRCGQATDQSHHQWKEGGLSISWLFAVAGCQC